MYTGTTFHQWATDQAEHICDTIGNRTGDTFQIDTWSRDEDAKQFGGGGCSRVVVNGNGIEGGAVNTSHVRGMLDDRMLPDLPGEGPLVEATGISLILHPRNPHIPSIHMNVRWIQRGETQWFGGGVDLTPYLPDVRLFSRFHQYWKQQLDRIDPTFYPGMKAACDAYFTIPHRNEMRGIGGIFFDYLPVNEKNWKLVRTICEGFLPAYIPMLDKLDQEYSEADRRFQLFRRGRYVEFNLMVDRGTQFGLKTGGRIESILSSMPPAVRYEYDYHPEAGSPYAEMMRYYQPMDWVDPAKPESVLNRSEEAGA